MLRQKPAEDDDSDSEELINTEPEPGPQVEDQLCAQFCAVLTSGRAVRFVLSMESDSRVDWRDPEFSQLTRREAGQ